MAHLTGMLLLLSRPCHSLGYQLAKGRPVAGLLSWRRGLENVARGLGFSCWDLSSSSGALVPECWAEEKVLPEGAWSSS